MDVKKEPTSKVDPVDEQIIRAAKSGDGLIEIKNADALMEMANAAHSVFQHFRSEVNKIMTKERAEYIRSIRLQDYTWRAIARECHEKFNGTWQPVSNQLAGMALCEAAAEMFGEHYMQEPWN